MNDALFSLAVMLLLGLFAAKVIRRIKIPSITAYILLGIVLGPYAANIISRNVLDAATFIAHMALGFVAFHIGQNFSMENFSKIGKKILWISMGEVIGAFLTVTLSIWLLLKQPLYIALIIGAIAPATAPAAVMMVIRESKAKGDFTNTLLGVVAIDDAWGIILFAFCLAISKSLAAFGAVNGVLMSALLPPLLEIFGAALLGITLGLLLSFSSKYIHTQNDLLIFSLGFIFLNTGLATHLNLSILLANMFLGATLVNVNKGGFRIFESLRAVDPPIYLLFFVLAGAELDITFLPKIGLLGIVYVFTRLPGEMIGATIGAIISNASSNLKKWLGFGLAPQAGVALALALTAKNSFPVHGALIFSTIVATTIIYELIGPALTRFALHKAGDIS